MPSSPGRTSEPRTVASVVTNSTTAITFPSGTIRASDVGRTITGTGITAGTTIAAVGSATAATLSATATTSTTQTVTLGGPPGSSTGLGFTGWSPETDAESLTQQVLSAGGAGVNDPARLADSATRVSQRNR
jgi:hypothetical protein